LITPSQLKCHTVEFGKRKCAPHYPVEILQLKHSYLVHICAEECHMCNQIVKDYPRYNILILPLIEKIVLHPSKSPHEYLEIPLAKDLVKIFATYLNVL